jgi:hypothetical protein
MKGGRFDIFVDCRSQPVSPFKHRLSMFFYEWLPGTATILAAVSPPLEGPMKQDGSITSFDSGVLQIFHTSGTGDA